MVNSPSVCGTCFLRVNNSFIIFSFDAFVTDIRFSHYRCLNIDCATLSQVYIISSCALSVCWRLTLLLLFVVVCFISCCFFLLC